MDYDVRNAALGDRSKRLWKMIHVCNQQRDARISTVWFAGQIFFLNYKGMSAPLRVHTSPSPSRTMSHLDVDSSPLIMVNSTRSSFTYLERAVSPHSEKTPAPKKMSGAVEITRETTEAPNRVNWGGPGDPDKSVKLEQRLQVVPHASLYYKGRERVCHTMLSHRALTRF